jgi:hypothetical protein
MTTPIVEQTPPVPRRQFTLAGMLSYMLAVAVYCSMIAALRSLVEREFGPSRVWPVYTTIPTAWCVLWWLYRRWRLPLALKIHQAGPVIALGLLGVGFFVGIGIGIAATIGAPPGYDPAILRNVLEAAYVAMMWACGASTAVSLPAATLMLLYLMLRPASNEMS